MKKLRALLIASCMMMSISCFAQTEAQNYPKGPDLEYVCELRVKCEGTYSVGKTPKGTRTVIPIVGGTFEGPDMKGEILSGGADYQLIDQESGRTEIEAIYSIKTDDGVYIHIRNCGLITSGQGGFYFRTTPKFEAPKDSKYAWLNNAIFVCMPSFATDCICLRVWKVK